MPDILRRCATLIDALVALLPQKRRNAIAWIGAAGVLYVVVSLVADRSVREAATSWAAPAAVRAETTVPRCTPARAIAPVRALAIAPMASPPAALREATPAPAVATPTPTPHPHRRAKKRGAHKDR